MGKRWKVAIVAVLLLAACMPNPSKASGDNGLAPCVLVSNSAYPVCRFVDTNFTGPAIVCYEMGPGSGSADVAISCVSVSKASLP